MLAVSKYNAEKGVIVKIKVIEINKDTDTFTGECVSSNCPLSPVGSYATNWDRSAFRMIYEDSELFK